MLFYGSMFTLALLRPPKNPVFLYRLWNSFEWWALLVRQCICVMCMYIQHVVIYFNRSKTYYLDAALQHFNKRIQNTSTFHHQNGRQKKSEWLIASYDFSASLLHMRLPNITDYLDVLILSCTVHTIYLYAWVRCFILLLTSSVALRSYELVLPTIII